MYDAWDKYDIQRRELDLQRSDLDGAWDENASLREELQSALDSNVLLREDLDETMDLRRAYHQLVYQNQLDKTELDLVSTRLEAVSAQVVASAREQALAREVAQALVNVHNVQFGGTSGLAPTSSTASASAAAQPSASASAATQHSASAADQGDVVTHVPKKVSCPPCKAVMKAKPKGPPKAMGSVAQQIKLAKFLEEQALEAQGWWAQSAVAAARSSTTAKKPPPPGPPPAWMAAARKDQGVPAWTPLRQSSTAHSTAEAEIIAINIRPLAPTRDASCTARMGNDNRPEDLVFFTQSGECFHTNEYCPGLRSALAVWERRPCHHCSGDPVVSVEESQQGTTLRCDVTIRDRVRPYERRGLMKVPPTLPVREEKK